LKLGFVAVLAILAVVLIGQNTSPVETRLVFVTVTMPHAALLLGVLLVGVVTGIAVASRFLPAKSGQGQGETPPEAGPHDKSQVDHETRRDAQRV
jgi:uncharacterized integral membrane protein